MKIKKFFEGAVFIGLCLGAGQLGAIATFPNLSNWYVFLRKPPGNPPDWIFGPVWTILYILMGIAAWRIWQKRQTIPILKPLSLFTGQLLLNTAWSFLFFGFHRPGLAFAEIIVLWIMIVLTLQSFRKMDQAAGYLLAPYLLWVSFALYLNAGIWWLNR